MIKQISGSIGSIIASLCCLGFAPALAALSAAGLGFAISDAFLVPLLTLFLLLTLWGMKSAQKKHKKVAPFYIGLGAAIAALLGLFVFMPLHIAGLVTLVAASIWDVLLIYKHHATCHTPNNN